MAQAKKALSRTTKKKSAGGSSSNGKQSGARQSVKTYSNYIAGEWIPAASSEYSNINPADPRDGWSLSRPSA